MVVALIGAYLLTGVVGHDPWKQDEAYTFGIVLHLLETGDWIVPTLAGQPFMEKPPLFYFSAALSAWLFSPWLPLHDGARLAAAAWMAIALWTTGLAAKRLHGPDATWRAILLFAGCLGLVLHAHEMITDTALCAGFAIGFYGLTWSTEAPRRAGLWLGTGVGIGFMAKGLVEPSMMGLVCLLLPIASRRWRTSAYGRSLSLSLFFALPWLTIWPTALFLADRASFDTWLFVNNIGRFTGTAQLGANSEPFYYACVLPWFTLPVGPFALAAVARRWRRRDGESLDDSTVLACIAVLGIVAVLGSAATVRSLYAVPLLIPLTILAAGEPALVGARWFGHAASLFSGFCVTLAAFVWWVWLYGITHGAPPSIDYLLRWLPADFAFRFDATQFALALTTTLVAAATWLAGGAIAAPMRWLGGIAMVWGASMSLLLPWIDHAKSFRQPFTEIAALVPLDDCLVEVGLGEPQRGMLHYVAGLVPVAGDTEVCGYLLAQTNHRDDVPPVDADRWHPIWRGARPGENDEAFTLFERSEDGLPELLYAGELVACGNPAAGCGPQRLLDNLVNTQ